MLKIENLTKKYGKFLAVDNLNLHINKGEIFGFVGPNGAGKTTTMRIVCGLLKSTSGNVFVDGINAITNPDDIKRKVGYVPDFFGVYDNLKVMEYMEFYGSMYGMGKEDVDEISEGLLELVNLSDKKDEFVDTLSRGMKQRLCVARALIHNPDLLVLDEPNSGLDPRARFEMKEVLKNLGAMGKTIIISSHILPELSEMCTSIGIMERGRLIVSGKVEEIMQKTKGTQPIRMKAEAPDYEDSEAEKDYIVMTLKEQPLVTKVTFTEEEIMVSFTGDDKEAALLLKTLFERNILVSQFYREKEDLEALFLEITGGEKGMKKRLRMNPILKKELMVGSRSIKMSWALAGVNAFLTLIVVLVIVATNSSMNFGSYDYSALVALFPVLGCIECGVISFIVPIITSGSISGEREKQTLDIMLTTPITPFQIALGKLGSAMSVVMMYMISSIPIMAIAFVLGGMSWWALFGLIGMLLVIGIYVGSVGVFCSSVVKKSVVSTILTIAIGIGIIVVTLTVFGVSISIAEYTVYQLGTGRVDMNIIPLILFLNPYSGFFDFMFRSTTSSSMFEIINEVGNVSAIMTPVFKCWIPISIVINLLVSLGFLKLAALKIAATRNKKRSR